MIVFTNETDTIFAVASGAGRAALTVLRISGPGSGAVLEALCRRRPEPRVATLRVLRGTDDAVLDRALVLWFPGPGSYTGEDSAELHLHGGRAVLAAVADALVTLGARPAEPGEFTRRAFLNGRMDLLEAEAVADLVEAETAAQRTQALRQLEGSLGGVYRGWTSRLTRLLAQQEALIDFPDEDLPPQVEAGIRAEIAALAGEVGAHLDDGRRGERLRDGLVFVIAGPPNVGKSTLINRLAERDVAIVSPAPGTTRDVLETRVDLGGVPVTLLDTAGLRDSADAIEAEGVRRARARAQAADVVVVVQDASCPPTAPGIDGAQGVVIRVANKIDLARPVGEDVVGISALTGEGLDQLRQVLCDTARQLTQAEGPPPLTRARHRKALHEARSRLQSAGEAELPELRGEDLRLALRSIGRITGTVGVEDILDSVFGQFCIGK
ncbi:tRNA uridine-5-carboxymethylaminomethyl(34) synthesis GTPase MnmE [Limobrevibacterium gyesilva]|uniref:tRNA modification GTPase MnmE n=1 Tax=Limobrevibacterium gyesilva TaxID=2991712 RepID=A0AA41YIG9_9PROT|nr:tRNA uridine-5-carboxymethylaminomethyl(34) synthesis GTPase MnmE [Limobrevibacterium gyesilva]MCW3473649.1 tRNA uridine-5-carboxymethylaminomethyl(34) synthesis GTPase MnmE [Limobrevibacterium gyesilva]